MLLAGTCVASRLTLHSVLPTAAPWSRPCCWDRGIPVPLCWGYCVVSWNSSTCVSRADIQPLPEPQYSGQSLSVLVEFLPSLFSVSPEEVYKCYAQQEAAPNPGNCQLLYKVGACFVSCAAEACLKTVWEEALVEDGIQNSQLQIKSQCEFRGFTALQPTNLMQDINLCYLCLSGLVGSELWVPFCSWEDWLVLLSCFCLRREVSIFLFLEYVVTIGKSSILQHNNLIGCWKIRLIPHESLNFWSWRSQFNKRTSGNLSKTFEKTC